MTPEEKTRKTFRCEMCRAVATGVTETAITTFLLVIAVKWYHAGAWAKSLVATGGAAGLLMSPMVIHQIKSLGWTSARAGTVLSFISSGALLGMAAVSNLAVYAIGSVIAFSAAFAATPLFTQIYQENYPAKQRGRLFSRTFVIRIGVAALFGQIAGQALTGADTFGPYRTMLVLFAAAFALAGVCLSRIPTERMVSEKGAHPFRALHYAFEDKLFGALLASWMLFGMGNLMTLPLRVDYLANPEYGLVYDTWTIAMLMVVIPNVLRLVSVPVWGWLYDHANFFILRMGLNYGFAVSIVMFFTSHTMPWLVVSVVLFGLATAGGEVAWSLWVTRFAPKGRVADYMSVHTFTTGIRGMLSPFLGFYLVTVVSIRWVAWFAGIMIVVANLFIWRKAMPLDPDSPTPNPPPSTALRESAKV